MTGRLWTAVLVLAAVFAMHGVQCAAALGDHATDHVSTAAPEPAVSLDRAPGGHPAAMTVDAAEHPAATGAVVVAAAPAALLAADHGSTPAGAVGHLWTLCLAVLAAGLVVLLALLLPRLLTLLPVAWARLRTHASAGLAPLRPPDLHSLCLLRI
ncbi:hypothetical protein [Geodermatophilus sp. SYSU D00079]